MAMLAAILIAPFPAAAAQQPAATATVTIKTYYDAVSDPAGAGLQILVDDKAVGVTNASGQRKVTVPVGEHRFSVFDPSLAGASKTTTIKAGSTSLPLMMTGEGLDDVIKVKLVPKFGMVLSSTASTFPVTFLDRANKKIPLAAVRAAMLTQVNLGTTLDITDRLTTNAAGDIKLVSGASIGDVQAMDGVQTLEIWADSPKGYGVWGKTDFVVGRYAVTGKLKAPPSMASLPVGSLTVKVSLLGTSFSRSVKANASGSFSFADVPKGNIKFEASTKLNGKAYSLAGSVFVDGTTNVNAFLLGSADVLNGVPSIVVLSQAVAKQEVAASVAADRVARNAGLRNRAPTLQSDTAGPSAIAPVTISATAAAQDMPQTASEDLVIPKGTKKVRLVYEVHSFEYPYYVLQNSIFNDVWSLKIVTSTKVLFDITNNVNAQVSVPPIWQSDGSTGEIVEVLDVSALTKTGAVTLALFGSTTNIGDSLLATSFTASLGPIDSDFSVSYVGVTSATSGPKDVVSIPRPTKKNAFEKLAVFDIDSPAAAKTSDITNVKVQLLLGASATSGTEIYSGAVKKISDRRFAVPVTFTRSEASTVGSTPPAYGRVGYLVNVTAKIASVTTTTTSQPALDLPLWRMPDAIPRFGWREAGGDSWLARGTYTWLETNASAITRVDDISGEHGSNLGHVTHQRGTDIDIFQFYSLNSSRGLSNYIALEAAARKAVTGTPSEVTAAVAKLTTAITAERTGLTTLASNWSVTQLFTGMGRKVPNVLPAGWLKALMTTGTFTGANTAHTVVTIDSGATISSKVHFNDSHNSLDHITLNAASMTMP
ncbi:hypothetical protein [Oryzibacter oryziterrae]|uniref:hypothetical protein n=1 Tax=Oryzibacter oryziterrae TaxID=2766474 RepID=UPI001F46937A|nr:hypothetical protein [Oryzibacter oryziterrae]